MDQWVDLRIGADAGAFIQGWNDMVSGATKQNQGKPLSAMQLANLTMNFMFREPFLVGPLAQRYESLSAEQKKILDQVSKQPYASAALYHLDMTPDGIPMDQRNIDAMKMSLGRSHVIPVKP